MSLTMRDFQSVKTLLVTGGCGFIGSHFINYMHKTYPSLKIVNVDRVDYCSDPDHIQDQNDSWYTLYQLDINQSSALQQILTSNQVDAVVHFAAQSHVDNSFGNSISFTLDNVLGTHSLMECCRLVHQERPFYRIVHISTDEVYGEVELDHSGCHEKSILNPTNPYAASKAGAEFIVRSYFYSFKLPVIITRGNNVFGENQYPEKVIPKFITQMLNDEPVTIQGGGSARRNFIYVDNVSQAVECILKNGVVNEVYNIGCDDEYSVMDIANILAAKLNKPLKTKDIADRCFNDQRYCIDSSKLKQIGWKCTVDFDTGLTKVVDWWKAKSN